MASKPIDPRPVALPNLSQLPDPTKDLFGGMTSPTALMSMSEKEVNDLFSVKPLTDMHIKPSAEAAKALQIAQNLQDDISRRATQMYEQQARERAERAEQLTKEAEARAKANYDYAEKARKEREQALKEKAEKQGGKLGAAPDGSFVLTNNINKVLGSQEWNSIVSDKQRGDHAEAYLAQYAAQLRDMGATDEQITAEIENGRGVFKAHIDAYTKGMREDGQGLLDLTVAPTAKTGAFIFNTAGVLSKLVGADTVGDFLLERGKAATDAAHDFESTSIKLDRANSAYDEQKFNEANPNANWRDGGIAGTAHGMGAAVKRAWDNNTLDNFVAEQVPQLLMTLGAGGVGAKAGTAIAGGVGKTALASSKPVATALSVLSGTYRTKSGITQLGANALSGAGLGVGAYGFTTTIGDAGAGAWEQVKSTSFDDIKKTYGERKWADAVALHGGEEQARDALAGEALERAVGKVAPVAAVTSFLGVESTFAALLTRQAVKDEAKKLTLKGFAKGAGSTALSATEEGVEEGYTQYASNVGATEFTGVDLMEGVSSAAGMGAFMGGATTAVTNVLSTAKKENATLPNDFTKTFVEQGSFDDKTFRQNFERKMDWFSRDGQKNGVSMNDIHGHQQTYFNNYVDNAYTVTRKDGSTETKSIWDLMTPEQAQSFKDYVRLEYGINTNNYARHQDTIEYDAIKNDNMEVLSRPENADLLNVWRILNNTDTDQVPADKREYYTAIAEVTNYLRPTETTHNTKEREQLFGEFWETQLGNRGFDAIQRTGITEFARTILGANSRRFTDTEQQAWNEWVAQQEQNNGTNEQDQAGNSQSVGQGPIDGNAEPVATQGVGDGASQATTLRQAAEELANAFSGRPTSPNTQGVGNGNPRQGADTRSQTNTPTTNGAGASQPSAGAEQVQTTGDTVNPRATEIHRGTPTRSGDTGQTNQSEQSVGPTDARATQTTTSGGSVGTTPTERNTNGGSKQTPTQTANSLAETGADIPIEFVQLFINNNKPKKLALAKVKGYVASKLNVPVSKDTPAQAQVLQYLATLPNTQFIADLSAVFTSKGGKIVKDSQNTINDLHSTRHDLYKAWVAAQPKTNTEQATTGTNNDSPQGVSGTVATNTTNETLQATVEQPVQTADDVETIEQAEALIDDVAFAIWDNYPDLDYIDVLSSIYEHYDELNEYFENVPNAAEQLERVFTELSEMQDTGGKFDALMRYFDTLPEGTPNEQDTSNPTVTTLSNKRQEKGRANQTGNAEQTEQDEFDKVAESVESYYRFRENLDKRMQEQGFDIPERSRLTDVERWTEDIFHLGSEYNDLDSAVREYVLDNLEQFIDETEPDTPIVDDIGRISDLYLNINDVLNEQEIAERFDNLAKDLENTKSRSLAEYDDVLLGLWETVSDMYPEQAEELFNWIIDNEHSLYLNYGFNDAAILGELANIASTLEQGQAYVDFQNAWAIANDVATPAQRPALNDLVSAMGQQGIPLSERIRSLTEFAEQSRALQEAEQNRVDELVANYPFTHGTLPIADFIDEMIVAPKQGRTDRNINDPKYRIKYDPKKAEKIVAPPRTRVGGFKTNGYPIRLTEKLNKNKTLIGSITSHDGASLTFRPDDGTVDNITVRFSEEINNRTSLAQLNERNTKYVFSPAPHAHTERAFIKNDEVTNEPTRKTPQANAKSPKLTSKKRAGKAKTAERGTQAEAGTQKFSQTLKLLLGNIRQPAQRPAPTPTQEQVTEQEVETQPADMQSDLTDVDSIEAFFDDFDRIMSYRSANGFAQKSADLRQAVNLLLNVDDTKFKDLVINMTYRTGAIGRALDELNSGILAARQGSTHITPEQLQGMEQSLSELTDRIIPVAESNPTQVYAALTDVRRTLGHEWSDEQDPYGYETRYADYIESRFTTPTQQPTQQPTSQPTQQPVRIVSNDFTSVENTLAELGFTLDKDELIDLNGNPTGITVDTFKMDGEERAGTAKQKVFSGYKTPPKVFITFIVPPTHENYEASDRGLFTLEIRSPYRVSSVATGNIQVTKNTFADEKFRATKIKSFLKNQLGLAVTLKGGRKAKPVTPTTQEQTNETQNNLGQSVQPTQERTQDGNEIVRGRTSDEPTNDEQGEIPRQSGQPISEQSQESGTETTQDNERLEVETPKLKKKRTSKKDNAVAQQINEAVEKERLQKEFDLITEYHDSLPLSKQENTVEAFIEKIGYALALEQSTAWQQAEADAQAQLQAEREAQGIYEDDFDVSENPSAIQSDIDMFTSERGIRGGRMGSQRGAVELEFLLALPIAVYRAAKAIWNAIKKNVAAVSMALAITTGTTLAIPTEANAATPTETAVVQNIVERNDNQGKQFIVADKQAGTLTMYTPSGQQITSTPALFGKTEGDSVSSKNTPSGRFETKQANVRTKGYGGSAQVLTQNGQNLQLDGTPYAIHRVYTRYASENRQGRLDTTTATDNRISHGCINVPVDFYDTYLNSSQDTVVYVMPETAAGRTGVFDVVPTATQTATNTKEQVEPAYDNANAQSVEVTPEQLANAIPYDKVTVAPKLAPTPLTIKGAEQSTQVAYTTPTVLGGANGTAPITADRIVMPKIDGKVMHTPAEQRADTSFDTEPVKDKTDDGVSLADVALGLAAAFAGGLVLTRNKRRERTKAKRLESKKRTPVVDNPPAANSTPNMPQDPPTTEQVQDTVNTEHNEQVDKSANNAKTIPTDIKVPPQPTATALAVNREMWLKYLVETNQLGHTGSQVMAEMLLNTLRGFEYSNLAIMTDLSYQQANDGTFDGYRVWGDGEVNTDRIGIFNKFINLAAGATPIFDNLMGKLGIARGGHEADSSLASIALSQVKSKAQGAYAQTHKFFVRPMVERTKLLAQELRRGDDEVELATGRVATANHVLNEASNAMWKGFEAELAHLQDSLAKVNAALAANPSNKDYPLRTMNTAKQLGDEIRHTSELYTRTRDMYEGKVAWDGETKLPGGMTKARAEQDISDVKAEYGADYTKIEENAKELTKTIRGIRQFATAAGVFTNEDLEVFNELGFDEYVPLYAEEKDPTDVNEEDNYTQSSIMDRLMQGIPLTQARSMGLTRDLSRYRRKGAKSPAADGFTNMKKFAMNMAGRIGQQNWVEITQQLYEGTVGKPFSTANITDPDTLSELNASYDSGKVPGLIRVRPGMKNFLPSDVQATIDKVRPIIGKGRNANGDTVVFEYYWTEPAIQAEIYANTDMSDTLTADHLRSFGTATRAAARLVTVGKPVWNIYNFVRDSFERVSVMLMRPVKDHSGKLVPKWKLAMEFFRTLPTIVLNSRDIYRYLVLGEVKTPLQANLNEAVGEGAINLMTTQTEKHSVIGDLKKSRLEKAGNKVGKWLGDTANKTGAGDVRNALSKGFDFYIVTMTEIPQVSTALASYMAYQNAGVNKKESANRVRDTYDPNRTNNAFIHNIGQFHPFVRSTFSGHYNLARSLTQYWKPGEWQFTLAYTLGGTLGVIGLLSMLAGAFDDDDDGRSSLARLPLSTLMGGLPVPWGEDGVWTLPVGFGMNKFIWGIGANYYRYINGYQSAGETAMGLAGLIVDNTSPIQASGGSNLAENPTAAAVLTAMPMLLKPIVELGFNVKAYGGGKIYGKDTPQDQLNSQQDNFNTPETYKKWAGWLNENGFGDYRPETLRHLFESYGNLAGPLSAIPQSVIADQSEKTLGNKERKGEVFGATLTALGAGMSIQPNALDITNLTYEMDAKRYELHRKYGVGETHPDEIYAQYAQRGKRGGIDKDAKYVTEVRLREKGVSEEHIKYIINGMTYQSRREKLDKEFKDLALEYNRLVASGKDDLQMRQSVQDAWDALETLTNDYVKENNNVFYSLR